MNHRLALRLAAVDGALLRVLGTVERRGFRVVSCAVDGDGDGYRVQLEVDGRRDPGLLCRQLDRLLDVRAATPIVPTPPAPTAAQDNSGAADRGEP